MSNRSNWPQWLKDAKIEDARVDIRYGRVIWHDGIWLGGDWLGGDWYNGDWHSGRWLGGAWHSGVWRGGIWRDGIRHGGTWHGGVWLSGKWNGGQWLGGTWHDGIWLDGDWLRGVWYGGTWYSGNWHSGVWYRGNWRDTRIDRLLFHASFCGITFDDHGYATAYRSTYANGRGRHCPEFIQPEGEYYEYDAAPAGRGTCYKGIHVTSQGLALTYFGIATNAQLWKVRFHRDDLLDCDGEKARIRGGTFTKIPWPFFKKETNDV